MPEESELPVEVDPNKGERTTGRATWLVHSLKTAGAFSGLADKLRTEGALVSDATEIKPFSEAVVRRLDIEYRASESAVTREPEPVPEKPAKFRPPPKSNAGRLTIHPHH